MSRIGKKPIEIPAGVSVKVENTVITVTGPKGTLSRTLPGNVEVAVEGGSVQVVRMNDEKSGRSEHGLTRTLVANMIGGVSKGFEKGLEIVGVGYRGEIEGRTLKLLIGFSTPVLFAIPDGVSIKVEKQTGLTVSGINKELVGMVAAEIRDLKKPEPYKGKGIRYVNERVRRKVGKSAGA